MTDRACYTLRPANCWPVSRLNNLGLVVYLPLTDILPDVMLISSLSKASIFGLPLFNSTPPSNEGDGSASATLCAGALFFSSEVERAKISSLDKLICAFAAPVTKILSKKAVQVEQP
jgi:hypothetical protein